MCYLRVAFGITVMDELRYEEVYEKYNMIEMGEGINCGIIECVKRNTEMVWTSVKNVGRQNGK